MSPNQAMNTPLIRTEEGQERGMFVTAVYGLNIFVTNQQAIPFDQDPRVEFMRVLGEGLFRVAHVGDLALEGDDPQTYFMSETWNSPHVVTCIGLYNNDFYATKHRNGYVFFDVRPAFWMTKADERSGGINYVIGDDSLAMYIHHDTSPLNALIELLEQPIPNVSTITLEKPVLLEDWIDRITMLFDYCAYTSSDGWQTHIYSRNPIPTDFVAAAVAASTKKIVDSEWYVAHKNELVWEDYLAGCMVTPERQTYFRAIEKRHKSERK